jgi:hypothetical protein
MALAMLGFVVFASPLLRRMIVLLDRRATMVKVKSLLVFEDDSTKEVQVKWYPMDMSEQAAKERELIHQKYLASKASTKN